MKLNWTYYKSSV